MTDMRVLCSKCQGGNVLVYMTVASAICPNCCDDHDYRYEGRGDGHMCIHCGANPPDDWYDVSD